ncbi:EthD family reductase [Nitriliruptoraceae bacterium ZYF776]|nr:EthD family reductase [Profundirhabdus halotolerans]
MASVIVLYTAPQDPEGFDAHYRDTHVPLAKALPNLSEMRAHRILGTPRGGDAAYYLQAELVFPTNQDMMSSLMSEAGMDVSRDAMHMTQTFGCNAEIMLAEDL